MTVSYVPQYEEDNQYYFAHGEYKSMNPVSVSGYELWVQIDALDTITTPYAVIARQSEGSNADLYEIVMTDDDNPQDNFFETAILSKPEGRVFFVPRDRFFAMEASKPCVRIPNGGYAACEFRFNVLAAFYRLSIIPTLSASIFAREDLFDSICQKFYETYRVHEPLEDALATIFSDLVFALDFFGFALPRGNSEKNSIDACLSLAASYADLSSGEKHTKRYFAFSELKFAIANYHRECFPDRTIDPEILDYESYSYLLNAVEFTRSTLSKSNLIRVELPPRKALSEAVISFQRNNKLPTGACDMFTFRHIWNLAVSDEKCDLMALCKLCGLGIKNPEPPVYVKTIGKIDCVPYNQNDTSNVQGVVNEVLDGIKDRSEAPQWMMQEAQKSVENQIKKIDEAAETARNIDAKVKSIQSLLAEASSQNEITANKFGETAETLEQVVLEHTNMKNDFSTIKKRIDEERRGNQVLLMLVIILLVLVLVRFFRGRAIVTN